MSAGSQSWPALSYLEGLRPGAGETVELAILASYSADLGSIGAALLALAGKDSETGRGSPSDFADAVERLRGKVRIVIQRGRLAKMQRTPRIAAVLDQFVREVDFDEAVHSWHPKAALVRLRTDQDETRWRLWIGSRNLTECVNRDIGLLMVSGGLPSVQLFREYDRTGWRRRSVKCLGEPRLGSSSTKFAGRTGTTASMCHSHPSGRTKSSSSALSSTRRSWLGRSHQEERRSAAPC
jgi:hypothetical protein